VLLRDDAPSPHQSGRAARDRTEPQSATTSPAPLAHTPRPRPRPSTGPTVLQALKDPRLLSREVLAGLVIAPVARDHGLDHFIATVILAGVFQVLFAVLGVAKLMRFIPRSVMVGFVNALAILIFTSQLPQLIDVPWAVYPLVAVGIVVIVLLPRLTKVVPAPLVAIVLLTAAVIVMGISVPRVGDEGELPRSLPTLFFPDVPLTLETFRIIAPYAAAMAVVGILESLMTAKLVDDITDTPSAKTRESWGQGASNVLSGFFGGMGGCAMIGQTLINVKASGARTRISTFMAGIFVLVLVVGLGDVVAIIPMAALVAVMVIVSVGTFDGHSIRPATLKRMPIGETAVMVRDASTVAALDAITTKYDHHGKSVEIIGMNDASTRMHARLAGNLGGGH